MKFESALNLILDINEKYERCDKKNTSERYFDVLHTSLFEIIRGYTEEQYNNFPESCRDTIMRLELDILDCCSKNYREKFETYINENGRFYKGKTKEKSRMVTKCKHQIGFNVNFEEEASL